MDYNHDQIKHYFKNWIIDQGGEDNPKVLEYLKEHKDISLGNKDSRWMHYYDHIHQEAFPTEYPILRCSEACKAFLGNHTAEVREFVKEWELERYGGLGDGSIETDILDPVALVNRYFFIIGEDIVQEWMEDPINY